MPLRFALDENFPTPIVQTLGVHITEAELVSVREIDPRLQGLEDWELLLALHHDPRATWDGLITTDSGILVQARSLDILSRTGLALVVPLASGHDPLRATGLLLASLPEVCAKIERARGGIFRLNAPRVAPDAPLEVLAKLAVRQKTSPTALRQLHGLQPGEFELDPLSRNRTR